jgi:hypothetical protein
MRKERMRRTYPAIAILTVIIATAFSETWYTNLPKISDVKGFSVSETVTIHLATKRSPKRG